MTTTEKTTETTPETVDATSGRDRFIGAAKTAVAALVCSLIGGAVVATAMAHDRSRYLHFVGLVALVSVILLAVAAYRTYVSPGRPPVLEETTPDATQEAA